MSSVLVTQRLQFRNFQSLRWNGALFTILFQHHCTLLLKHVCVPVLLLRKEKQQLDHYLSFADEAVLSSMHRYRPQFLAVTMGPPTYYEPPEFKHICFLQSKHLCGLDAGPAVSDLTSQSIKCVASPFVGSTDFCASVVSELLKKIVKEVFFLIAAFWCFCHQFVFCNLLTLVSWLCWTDKISVF